MPAFFSSEKRYPLTLKPITSPDEAKTYQDVFNLQNTLRAILRDLDTLLEGYVTEAPEDGKLYGRQDGEWEPITGGGGGGNYKLLDTVTLTTPTQDVVFMVPTYSSASNFVIEVFLVISSGANQYFKMFYNNDFNESRYNNIFLGVSTSANGGGSSGAVAIDMGAGPVGSTAAGSLKLFFNPGYTTNAQAYAANPGGNAGEIRLGFRTHYYNQTSVISNITLRHDLTFGTGTVIKFYGID